MGKADTWMPFYIADYLRKTMHLTRDQHGGYFLLLMACWDRGGRLPNDPDQLAGIARATPAEWRKLAPVLLPYFDIDGDHLTHGRVLEEREKAARLSDARREAGRQGGRPRKESNSESKQKPIGLQNHKQNETPARVRSLPSPETPPSEDNPPTPQRGGADGLFDEALKAYPLTGQASTTPGKAEAEWVTACETHTPERLLGAVKAYAASAYATADGGKRVPAFHRWLRDQKYLPWLPTGADGGAWPGDPDFRLACVHWMGEAWTHAWIDRCGWQDVPERALTAPNALYVDRIQREVETELKNFDVRVVLLQKASA